MPMWAVQIRTKGKSCGLAAKKAMASRTPGVRRVRAKL
jgi:hypothetical protein